MLLLPLILFPFLPTIVSSADSDSVLVHTSYGTLEGFVHSLENGSRMDVFLGVPYAQPPVGELRFEKPLPPQSWEGIRLARQQGAACVPHARPAGLEPIWSGTDEISEDCLFLNIFAPHREGKEESQVTANASSNLFPILFVIHGGAFEVGSSRSYDYKGLGERFVSRGILVITVQYRLGVLGFASTGDKFMPGNLGLWDIVEALRWVRREVARFGGDPRRVTAQGYSAGAAAVSALGMSPYGRSLFRQAIQMSGSMLAPTKTGAFVANETRQLATALECPEGGDSLALKECLRARTIQQIHEAVDKIGPTRSDVNFAKFASREDGHFFPRDLVELIHESPPIPTLLGHCRLDSLAYTLLQAKNDSVTQFVVSRDRLDHFGQADFEHFVRQVVAKEDHFGPSKAAEVQAEIIDYFTRVFKVPGKKDSRFYLERYTMVLSDLHYVMPAVWEWRLKANWGWPLFLYEFAWTEPGLFPGWVQVREAFHSLDHDLLFGGGQLALDSAEAKAVGRLLVEAIANFVLNGNPSTGEVLWVPASQADPMRHLLVDGPRPRMRQQTDDLDRLKFWHKLTETHKQFNLIKGAPGPRKGHDEL